MMKLKIETEKEDTVMSKSHILKRLRLMWAIVELTSGTIGYLLVSGVLLWRAIAGHEDGIIYVALALLLLGARARPCYEAAKAVSERKT